MQWPIEAGFALLQSRGSYIIYHSLQTSSLLTHPNQKQWNALAAICPVFTVTPERGQITKNCCVMCVVRTQNRLAVKVTRSFTATSQLRLPAFYGTWNFITVFTRARHFSLSWARTIHFTPNYEVIRVCSNFTMCKVSGISATGVRNRWILLKNVIISRFLKIWQTVLQEVWNFWERHAFFKMRNWSNYVYIWKNCGLKRKTLKYLFGKFYLGTELRRNLGMSYWTLVLFTASRWEMKLILLMNNI
jgi:hypothetical protein